MKNGLTNKIITDMKNYKNYICLFLLLLGMSVSQEVLGQVFIRVESVGDLSNGDEVIFIKNAAVSTNTYAMGHYTGTDEKPNYKYSSSEVSISSDAKITLSSSDDVEVFKVKKLASGDYPFAFHNGSGYLQQRNDGTNIEITGTAYNTNPSGAELWSVTIPDGGNPNYYAYVQNYRTRPAGDNTSRRLIWEKAGNPYFGTYLSGTYVSIYKKETTVMFYQGAGGNSYVTGSPGAILPTSATAVPGWDFIQYWSTDKNWAGDWSQSSKYTYADGTATASGYVYYAVYQGNVTGCNYGDISCKPQPVYSLTLNNPSSGSGVNWVVADVGCGSAGTTVTLTYTINVPGTSYQGATITRDDNGQAVSFTHDPDEQTITFTLPTSDVTAEISFDCPDLTSKTVTINDIVPYYDGGVWKANVTWDAVSGATEYGIQVNDITGGSTFLSETDQAGTSRLLTGLTEGHTYRAIVQANNPCASGNHTPSATKDFTPACPTLTGTLAISKDAVGQTSAAISWGGVTTTAIPTGSGSSSVISYDVSITVEGGAEGGVYSATGTTDTEWSSNSLTTNKTYTVTVHAYNVCGDYQDASTTFKTYNYIDYQFTCADLSLTDEDGTHAPIWITSTAGKMVRSQKALHIEGTGLKPNGAFTFTIGGVAANNCASGDVFAIRQADGSAVTADASGNIDMDVYVFYQPSVATDGVDLNAVGTEIVATSASGTVPPAVREYRAMTATLANVAINGRHLPSQFVVAGKKNNKWYAMPANMASTTNPKPSEIAVDDTNNPSIAYTASSNIYSMEGPTSSNISGGKGDYIRFVMTPLWADDADHSKGHAPLFGKATGNNEIGKSGDSQATSDLASGGWWWKLVQTNASATNAQSTKYTIYNHNNTSSLSLRDNAGNPDWGLFASGVEELRLIPASDIPFTEAYFIEWGRYGGVIEVDATGISATKVKATLNGTSSLVKTLSQTLTSGKSRASIYNYTLNFNDLGNVIDFSAAASNGALLTLDWYNSSDVLVAKTTMVVPKIIATNGVMHDIMSGDEAWRTEVHVLPDVTLTADAGSFLGGDVVIKQLEIYPGATVKVTTGTLSVTSLVLRNGWTRAGAKRFDRARLFIMPKNDKVEPAIAGANLTKSNISDVWYTDWYVDYDLYYSISVPWEVTLANVKYRYCSVSPTVGGDDGNIRLRYYDGEQRASTAQSQIGQNWKDYGKAGNKAVPAKLLPSMGYAMNAKRPSGKAFSIIRMPMDFPGDEWTALGEHGEVSSVHKNQVTVTGWGYGTSTPWYAMGWNFIGNPYMCEFSGNDDGITGKMELQNGGSIRYATIPDEGFKNFDQVNIATEPLKPASGFFIQANSASEETITFNASKIVPPSAPERYMTQTEAIPEQEAYIRLSYEGGKDQMGLIIGEDYTAAYEVNADLAKVLGDAGYVKTYMRYADMDLAYVAINKTLAREWIPVTVILPTSGEYTYSLMSSSEVEHLEGVYLIDYTTNEITNLIENDYVFTATAGTINNRFAINATVGERQTPTEIDVIGADKNGDEPIKFLYHDKVFIWHHGVIYDATGKKVREINK